MDKVVYLPEAEEDLFDIWRYVLEESESLEIADKLVDSIDDKCQAYANQPEIGQLRPDLSLRVRCFPVGNYVVFYLPLDEGIEVIQVIHGARDIPVQFRRSQDEFDC